MRRAITVVPSRRPLWSQSGRWGNLAPVAEGGASGRPEESERILIVEDDVLIASEMEAALTDEGFEVAGTASTGKEALQLAASQSPTLVVMDVRLAGDRDGIETA